MTTSTKHPELNLEQSILKEAWQACCDKVKKLESEIVEAKNQLDSKHNRNTEDYGLIPLLNRKIKDSRSKANHYELAKNKLYFGK